MSWDEMLISVHECGRSGEPANVVDGLFQIARALESVARALDRLGTADAATPQGAIELLAGELKHGTKAIAIAIESLHAEES